MKEVTRNIFLSTVKPNFSEKTLKTHSFIRKRKNSTKRFSTGINI